MIIWYIVVWCLCNWPLSGLVSAHCARRLAAIETNLTFSCTCSFSYKQRSKLLRHFTLRWTVTIICYFLLKFHSSTGDLLRSLRHSSFRTSRPLKFRGTLSRFLFLNLFFFLFFSFLEHFALGTSTVPSNFRNIEALVNIERMRDMKKRKDINIWILNSLNNPEIPGSSKISILKHAKYPCFFGFSWLIPFGRIGRF